MKKNLFCTLICVSIIASMLSVTGVSAATLANPDEADGAWGAVLQQYSDRSPYVTNWDTSLHTVWAARSDRGYGDCIRVKRNSKDGDNWVHLGGKLGSSAALLTVGTEYTISIDYLPGPKGYSWPSIGLQFYVGGQYITFAQMDNPNAKEWKTFSADFTATGQYPPRMKLTTKSADIYLDNLVITEKSTRNVVFYNNFDMIRTNQPYDWGYNPGVYAETKAVPFYGLPAKDGVGVIEHDDGYAAYFTNETGAVIDWRFSNMEAVVNALPNGQYKVKFEYIYCGTAANNNYLADRMSWDETWNNAANNVWNTYEKTFTKSGTKQCGFKIKNGCRIAVDNLRVEDLEGNVLAIEDFDTVPLLSGANQFIIEPITLSQSNNTMTASAKVTNSFADTKSVSLITAIYNNNILEDLDCINLDIVGDPRGISHTTTVNSEIGVSGKTGKTFKAFLWDGLDAVKSFADSATKTIE